MITDKPDTEILEGKIYDAETGEYLGDVVEPTFKVKDEESLNWVLGKILEAESEYASILNSPEVIKANAVLANAVAMQAEKQKRIDWFTNRFSPEIAEYVRPMLKDSKTFKTVLGSVGFRTVKGGLRVTDKEKALEWASRNALGAIKTTQEFQISKLTDEDRESLTTNVIPGFDNVPDREVVTIKSGVQK